MPDVAAVIPAAFRISHVMKEALIRKDERIGILGRVSGHGFSRAEEDAIARALAPDFPAESRR